MKTIRILAMLVCLGTVAHAAPALRRYALVIGSNNGRGESEKLRYAGHDAANVADVLQQLGGVTASDLAKLDEPNTQDVDGALDTLSRRIAGERQKGQRVELVVYYSGHADESGILVGGGRYDYVRLRERIRAVPADVRIAIVDSCASGSFTRIKGGTKMPPFLKDTSNQVEGFAFLSSSSATEDAQESDKIGASFFTYYFVGGLRGAADRNHDGKITLTEAYQFAYEQTLGRTQNTVHGPQHPAYDMHLSGTGDVVITDLRSPSATLVLPAALRGRITIIDKTGRVAIELTKDAGEPATLALPNETYTLHVNNKKGSFAATVTIDHIGEVDFDPAVLHAVSPEDTRARGPGDDVDDDDHEVPDPTHRNISFGFGGGMRLETPSKMEPYDGLITIGGTERSIHGHPVVGVADTGELALGMTVGDTKGFAYNMSLGVGPGVFVGDNLQIGATIGLGLDGITSNVLPFGFKMPTELFAVLELSPSVRPMAYIRQSYIFDSDMRKHGSRSALWGDEAEVGGGFRFDGKLDGFLYLSIREAMGMRWYGLGAGAIL
jgi:hypothetical protein